MIVTVTLVGLTLFGLMMLVIVRCFSRVIRVFLAWLSRFIPHAGT